VARIVLTLVGPDRAGLVAAVADVVSAHDANWEASQLAELAGTFAGVVQVAVADARADALATALHGLDGMLAITTHPGGEPHPASERALVISVLGNDHPGIVRDVTSVLSARGVSIERMTTDVRDAAMYGGRLFEASVTASVGEGVDLEGLRADLERLATEIQVDIALA